MSEVTVIFDSKREPIKENIERDLKWYDHIRGEMLTFRGGELEFEYKEDDYLVKMGEEERLRRGVTSTYRMIPKPKNLKIINYNKTQIKTNKDLVKKWLKRYFSNNYDNINVISENNNGIIVSVSDKELDDFLYDAERNGFRTEI
jgi:hypothetical protein